MPLRGHHAGMAKLVDAQGLGPCAERRASSSLASGNARMVKWQTRQIQGLVPARAWRFKSSFAQRERGEMADTQP